MKYKAEIHIQNRLCHLAADDLVAAEGLLNGVVKALDQTKRHHRGIMIQTMLLNTQLIALETLMVISKRYLTIYSEYRNFLETSKETAFGHEKSILEYSLKKIEYLEMTSQSAQKACTSAERRHNLIPKKSYTVKEDLNEEQLLDSLNKLEKYIGLWSLARNSNESGNLSTLQTNLIQIINYIKDIK
ncbi:MAG: hypothetical protein IKU20_02105 [Lachnospiraceae bacterium]|nr:hypothetical protein [Lachnospiraceae bacterium]